MDFSKQHKEKYDDSIEEEEILELLDDDFNNNDSDLDSDNIPIFVSKENEDRFVLERDDESSFGNEMLSLEDIGKHFVKEEPKKEQSPEDVIFINDKKVSINSLKNVKHALESPSSISKLLDDITEESSEVEPKEKDEVHDKNQPKSVIDKGSMLRNALKDCFKQNPDEDESDYCAQQQHQLRDIFSIGTTSTDYKTINEYFNSNDYQDSDKDRESYVKRLQNQLIDLIQEQVRLSSENDILKSQFSKEKNFVIEDEDSETLVKRLAALKNSMPSEVINGEKFGEFWLKFENFIREESEIQNAKLKNAIKNLKITVQVDKSEHEAEINKLHKLLKSVKSSSQNINEYRHEIETIHAKEMQDLRLYFEKRCADYSDKVLSQMNSINSKTDLLSDDDDNNHHRQHKMIKDEFTRSAECDLNNEVLDFSKKKRSDDDHHLKEQTRKDVIHEMERNIQTLLSGNFHDDSNWPSELILLREKLTASNQLEIAQLKIRHEEEMSRLKSELERKQKRNAAFDENRNLDEILSERDNLRELSESLRFTLCELAKCINQYESDLNNSLQDESSIMADPNFSTISINTKRLVTFKPDVTNLLAVVEDPTLLDYIHSKNNTNTREKSIQINIVDYMNRLKVEANNILELTEQLNHQQHVKASSSTAIESEKADSCEEEDGLKRSHMYKSLSTPKKTEGSVDNFKSLPVTLDNKNNSSNILKSGDSSSNIDDDEDDEHQRALVELRSKVRDLLSKTSSSPNQLNAHQVYEDFCRATDSFVEGENQLRDDLVRQLEVADKQIKSNKKFLDEQATERDQERDEYTKEIEYLRTVLREKGEKDKSSIENYEKKLLTSYEDQIKDMSAQLENLTSQKQKFEQDLKDSIDKVFDLREIISDLEGQIQLKVNSEEALMRKCEDLENFIHHQNEGTEIMNIKESEYVERIAGLEEQLKLVKPSNEQKLMFQQMSLQLKAMEKMLDKKINTLEAFHALASSCSATACSSPSEDVSKGFDVENYSEKSPIKTLMKLPDGNSMPLEDILRIMEKFTKHNRMEEATVKKVADLEMTVNVLKNNLSEIQQEKDILDERISEQLMKISSLQTRLDEQRIQSEEMNKQNNSDLTLRVHDLHNELSNLKETLSARDKQISNLNQLLEHSKAIIERQDQELAIGTTEKSYERLHDELKQKEEEISLLRDKMKTEMINKAVIPDLMETMIAEKNEEIDTLREKVAHLSHQFGVSGTSKQSSIESALIETLKSDFEEPEVLRRIVEPQHEYFLREHEENTVTKDQHFTMNESSPAAVILTDKATIHTSQEHSHTAMMPSHLVPRKIDFNSLEEMSTNISDDVKIHNELEQACTEIDKLKTFVEEQSKEISNLQVLLETKEKLYNEIRDERNQHEEKLKGLQSLTMKCNAYENDMKRKNEETSNLILKVQDLEFSLASHKQDLEDLHRAMSQKDEIIRHNSDELVSIQSKCRENESILSDLENLKRQVNSYDGQMCEKEAVLRKMEVDLINYVKNEQILLNKAEKYDKLLDLNQQLEVDIESLRKELCAKSFSLEKYKIDLQDMERQVHSLKGNEVLLHQEGEGHSIVEIAHKLDKEISYAAELDGNIIDAIKSESEMSSELDEIGSRKTDQARKKMKNLEFELDHYKEKYKTILNELEEERKYFNDIHQQDANLIESMNLRLKLALDNEATFKKMLEHEKLKIATLSGVQRTKSFDNNILFKKSFTEFDLLSPARKSNELDSEIVQRLKSEIKLLSSQNDCEKDRVLDLQTVVERERDRFKRTLVEQQMYIDQLKKEIQTQLNNNQLLRMELDAFRASDHRMKPEGGYVQDIEHLEEQNHYLIGRFMRSESFRKALIFQKKFLLITLSTKIGISTSSLYKIDNKKRKTFRSIALLIIAIERFKFIAKRWTGKRLMPQAAPHHFTPPKRSQSASNNGWIHNFRTNNATTTTMQQPKMMTQSKQNQLLRIQNLFHDNQ